MSGSPLRTLAWSAAAMGLLAAGWHFLGQVPLPTQPSVDTPSQPTVLPVNEADQALQEGRQWAQTHGITRHRDCKQELGPGLRARGCHEYVTAQKKIAPLERDGLTLPRTRDCVAAVHAHYDPVLQDMAEQGDYRAASVWQYRVVAPLEQQCNNIDNLRFLRDVHEPMQRLNAMLSQLRAGQTLAEADLAVLRREYPEVELFRDHPERTRYLNGAQELFGLLGGREQVFPLALEGSDRNESCAALAQQVATLRNAFHQSLSPASPDSASAQPANQDRLLADWRDAEDARQKWGCPQLR